MTWRWFLLMGCGIAAAGATYLWRQENLPCPTTGEILSRAQITEGAFSYVAAHLRYMQELSGTLSDDGTLSGLQITAQTVQNVQPDCCKIVRNVPEGLEQRIERVLWNSDGPDVRAYVEATIDHPALLPENFASSTVTVAIDVCGSPVQDWFDLSPPVPK